MAYGQRRPLPPRSTWLKKGVKNLTGWGATPEKVLGFKSNNED